MSNVRFGFTPTHPGEVLKDEIEYRGITQKDLAKYMDMPYGTLNDILNGRKNLTTSTAMMFAAALNLPEESLLQLQMKYDMYQANHTPSLMKRLEKIRGMVAML